jgi:hypothetical protein
MTVVASVQARGAPNLSLQPTAPSAARFAPPASVAAAELGGVSRQF